MREALQMSTSVARFDNLVRLDFLKSLGIRVEQQLRWSPLGTVMMITKREKKRGGSQGRCRRVGAGSLWRCGDECTTRLLQRAAGDEQLLVDIVNSTPAVIRLLA
jgi:hypothetical protein